MASLSLRRFDIFLYVFFGTKKSVPWFGYTQNPDVTKRALGLEVSLGGNKEDQRFGPVPIAGLICVF